MTQRPHPSGVPRLRYQPRRGPGGPEGLEGAEHHWCHRGSGSSTPHQRPEVTGESGDML